LGDGQRGREPWPGRVRGGINSNWKNITKKGRVKKEGNGS